MNAPHRSGIAIAELLTLVVGKTITRFVRWVCVALTVAVCFLGYGPLFDPDGRAYTNPVFDGVFAFASPQAWGIGFITAGAVLLVAAMSGRAVVYLVGITIAALTLAGWSGLIIREAIIDDDAVLTSGAIGLYVASFTAIIGLAASPDQLEVARPLELVVDDDTEPLELRRVGSRTG